MDKPEDSHKPLVMKYEKLKRYHQIKQEIREMMDREPTEDELDDAIAGDPTLGDFKARDFETFEIDQDEDQEVELRFRLSVSNMNLVKARNEKGLTQLQMSDLMGKGTAASYGLIETLRVYPNEECKNKIASILGKSKDHLFPSWLEIFTKRWSRQQKQKSVKIRAESLSSPEVAGLLTEPSSMQRDVERELLKEQMKPVLSCLNEREKKIIDLRFGLTDGVGHTLEEVAKMFDVNRERIRQIETKAIEKMQNNPAISKVGFYDV